jgi:putative cell wall-binding protein
MRRIALAVLLAVACLVGFPPAVAADHVAETQVDTGRLAGTDRYGTAAAIARAAHPDGVPDAVLARGDLFPDALAGAHLAGAVGGPVLLTSPGELHLQASEALAGAGDVVVLGGPAAVSEAVVETLRGRGHRVSRVAGDDRYGTAAAAAAVATAGRDPVLLDGKRTALLASGEGFADALSGGPLAAVGLPLLLTPRTALAPAAERALAELEVEHVVVLGGTAAVSDEVVAAVEATGVSVERAAGDDRAATAAAVADLALDRLGWDGTRVLLARQDAFPDGLAGGPLGAALAAPVLLTAAEALTAATAAWLEAHHGDVRSIVVLGGTAAVSDETLAAARSAAGHVDLAPYRVEGTHAFVPLGGDRVCRVVVPDGLTAQVRLLPGLDVVSDPLGFRDGDGDGAADERPVAAGITHVDGRALTGPAVRLDDVTPDGPLEITISSATYDHVALVVFTDGEGGRPRVLDLDAGGAPDEEAAAGCRTRFAPGEAVQGSHGGVIVHVVDVDGAFLLDAGLTRRFHWSDADEFLLGEAPIDRGRFEALLSRGDGVDVDHRIRDDGSSTFVVTDDAVASPGTPTPVATTLDGGPTSDDVRVGFEVPPHNGAGTRYRVFRARTHLGEGGCSSSIAETGTTIATVAEAPYHDLGVSSTGECFVYRIVTVASEGGVLETAFSAPVLVPGPPPESDTTRPRSVHVELSDAGSAGRLDAGDVVRIAFSEQLAPPSSGAAVTVHSGSAGATITNGSGATFQLTSSDQIVGGATRPAGTVLVVTLTASPASVIDLPADITSQTGVADLAGNPWDIAASSARRIG